MAIFDEASIGAIERITKLDAAVRQLRTAIRLFFTESDAVSIHTLASASQDVLYGLLKQKRRRLAKGGVTVGSGRPLSFKDRDNPIVRPEKRDDFLKLITEAQNFFKHAQSDPERVLEFRPATNDWVLIDCVDMHIRYTGQRLRESVVFVPWFAATYPDTLRSGLSTPGQTSALDMITQALAQVSRAQWKEASMVSLETLEFPGAV